MRVMVALEREVVAASDVCAGQHFPECALRQSARAMATFSSDAVRLSAIRWVMSLNGGRNVFMLLAFPSMGRRLGCGMAGVQDSDLHPTCVRRTMRSIFLIA